MAKPVINYLELPVTATVAAKAFYEKVFGWKLTDFGPEYSGTTDEPVNLGLQADDAEKTAALLPIVEVDDLEAFMERVEEAGGTITQEIFEFPGGTRFHFEDIDGHELAAWQPADE